MSCPDSEAIKASFDRHRGEPDITTTQHIRRLRIALGESIANRRAIYLDTKYWNCLRDAHRNRPKRPVHVDLLQELRNQVAAGKIFCPLNSTTFVELMQQTDPNSRVAIAQLVDELSLGIALCDIHERIATEIAHLFYRNGSKRAVYPLQVLAWVRLSFLFGPMYPDWPALPDAEKRLMQKAFIDHLWTRSMAEMIATLPPERPPLDLEATAQRLNEGNDAHFHELVSFDDAYCKEIEGTLDLCVDHCLDVIETMFEQSTGEPANSTPESREKYKPQIYGLLVALARNGKGRGAFPTLHADAKCHAANRWDRLRRLSSNTLLDFHHAVAALVYCDAFFTEHDMRSFLTKGNVALDREFDCAIYSDENDALAYLRKIESVTAPTAS